MPDTFTTIAIALAVVGFTIHARTVIREGRKKARDEDSFETPFGEIVNVPNRHGRVR